MDIKRLITLNVRDTLTDKCALEVLKYFLKKRSNGDKTLLELYVELFEKCQEYLEQSKQMSRDQFEALCDLGLPYDIEYGKLNMINAGDGKKCALLIMEELSKKIESQKEYGEFRKDLLKHTNTQ